MPVESIVAEGLDDGKTVPIGRHQLSSWGITVGTRKRFFPTPSMIVAMIALFVALGGAAYAGISLSDNSVSSDQIANGQVRNADLHNSSVDTLKIRNGTIRAVDLSPAARAALKGNQGIQGNQGPPGVVGAITVQRADQPLPPGVNTVIDAACPAGTRIIGGGGSATPSGVDIHLIVSGPSHPAPIAPVTDPPSSGNTFTGWRVVYLNTVGGLTTAVGSAYAICAQG